MAGYTQMIADDNATLVDLKILPEQGSRASVGLHDGRIFKTIGDGLPVEFASVVEAVASAGDIQRAVAARNLRLGCCSCCFRIGVPLGDVIAEGDDEPSRLRREDRARHKASWSRRGS